MSTIYAPTNQYWVVMELMPRYQTDPSALSLLYVRSDSGALVPLNSVASLKPDDRPAGDHHLGQLPSVTISFDLTPGVALSQAIARDPARRRRRCGSRRRSTARSRAMRRRSSRRSPGMGILLALAIFVIYLVLGILYESFIHPVTILSGLPTAGFGALLTLWLFHIDLNMYAFVGMIMLVGIVKKNAIIMIDFAIEAQRTEDKSPEEAIFEACMIALPADHDDDHGGADGQPADRAGAGRRRRSAAAARARGRRRTDRVAGADALPHAGGLHLLRAVHAVADGAPRSTPPFPPPPTESRARMRPRH